MTNLTSGGSVEQIIALCHHGVLSPFCDLLSAKDDKTVSVVLDGVTNILMAADRLGEADKVTQMVEECGGLDKIEALQSHENEQLYKKALNIIDSFYGEEEDDQEAAPAATAEGFVFKAEEQQGGAGGAGNGQFNF